MESSTSRLSKEMEVQLQEKAMLHQSPFLMVNPVSPPMFGAPWVSKSALVFPSGLGYGHGVSSLCGGSRGEGIKMEFMFSKILTLSDVSKLNRLLIPRQDAEKYFPMSLGAMDNDGASFLSFEDSDGVLWHFRYSFWQSSKTYVLTRGWMTFVKEKRLSDGDTVSFYQRVEHAAGITHRFIYFKKKDHGSSVPHHVPPAITTPYGTLDDNWLRKALCSSSHYNYRLAWKHLSYGPVGAMLPNLPIPQSPLIPPEASLGMGLAKKRVRLFGVDLSTDSNEFCHFHGHTNDVV